jgi:hypothetical protein
MKFMGFPQPDITHTAERRDEPLHVPTLDAMKTAGDVPMKNMVRSRVIDRCTLRLPMALPRPETNMIPASLVCRSGRVAPPAFLMIAFIAGSPSGYSLSSGRFIVEGKEREFQAPVLLDDARHVPFGHGRSENHRC